MKLSMARWTTKLSVMALALVTPACAMDEGDSSEEIEGAADGEEGPIATSEDAITGSVAVGTTLQTTTALNLRTGPGTGYAIILGLPYGARVTVEVRLESQSILYRTLWLFAGAFAAAVLTLVALIWWTVRRGASGGRRGAA